MLVDILVDKQTYEHIAICWPSAAGEVEHHLQSRDVTWATVSSVNPAKLRVVSKMALRDAADNLSTCNLERKNAIYIYIYIYTSYLCTEA